MGLAGLGGGGFDHVGVDGALGQPVDVLQFGGLGIEHLDEGVADDLALGLRIADTLELAEEQGLGIGADDLDAHVPGEHVHHLVPLSLAQQAVVDEHAGELVADGAVQQGRHHRGVDAAGEAEQHLVAAHLLPHPGDGVGRGQQQSPEPQRLCRRPVGQRCRKRVSGNGSPGNQCLNIM